MMPVTREISMAVGTTLKINDVMRKLMPLLRHHTKKHRNWGIWSTDAINRPPTWTLCQ
jgi:hypothetical protein